MLKTFSGKYRTRISRIIQKYRQGKDFVVEYPKKNGQVGKVLFYNNGFRRDTKVESGNPDVIARVFENYGRNSLIRWSKARGRHRRRCRPLAFPHGTRETAGHCFLSLWKEAHMEDPVPVKEEYTYQVGKIQFIVTPVYKDKGESMRDILLKLMLADLEPA